jgi:FkbM family methyltransferase
MGMEVIRRLIRGLIGADSRLYQAGAAFLDFISVTSKEGIRTWLTFRKMNAGNCEPGLPVPVSLQTLQYPIYIRPGTPDVSTIINNVIREEYGHFSYEGDPEWMIDAGAYIGDTAAYFLSRFSKLRVIALEPNPSAFAMASQNLKPYGARVILMKKGLWVDDKNLLFGGEGTGASIQDKGFAIECISIPTILKQFSLDRIDILKLDIEGAEKAIFATNPEEWLDRIGLLIIEIHGPEILHVVSLALQRNNFSMRQYRSVWYCRPRH